MYLRRKFPFGFSVFVFYAKKTDAYASTGLIFSLFFKKKHLQKKDRLVVFVFVFFIGGVEGEPQYKGYSSNSQYY